MPPPPLPCMVRPVISAAAFFADPTMAEPMTKNRMHR